MILKDNEYKIKLLVESILRFLRALKSKDFTLTAKQFYKIFVFRESYSCKWKDFQKGLHSIVEYGFLTPVKDSDNTFYQLNLTRFKIAQYLEKYDY